MFWMTESAVVVCAHQTGVVTGFDPRQSWVRVEQRRVLTDPDPAGRSIVGCPNVPPAGRPCLTTKKVLAGLSTMIQIDGAPVCLDPVTGMTDGVAPVPYRVRSPAQELVGSDA